MSGDLPSSGATVAGTSRVSSGMTAAQFPREQVDGAFVRQGDAFTGWVRADPSSEFPAEAGRYHLYVSFACPWAHRTIIVRALKGLEGAIGMTAVDPIRDDLGWAFREGPGSSRDPLNGFRYLSEAYLATDPSYAGRVTVPVLWDTKTRRIVSNNDDDIMRMLETEFDAFATHDIDLFPAGLGLQIDELNATIYEAVNNGVYRAGFATTQRTYEAAAYRLFEELERLEEPLPLRFFTAGNGLATLRDADPLRRGLRRPFQMQPATHRRLPELMGLPARPLPVPQRPRNGESRSHQAALLHDARRDQSNAHRSNRPRARPHLAPWKGEAFSRLAHARTSSTTGASAAKRICSYGW